MSEMLQTLYGYQAWANNDLLDKLALLDGTTQAAERNTALRLISHYHVVAEIFAAHLTGVDHGYTSDNTVETPPLDELRASVAATDRWYQGYVRTASPEALSEAVAFSFTDGDKGRMTKQEMLLHVALHSAVHRGEVCRILWQLKVMPPWDTLAVYLHQSEPARRAQSTAA
ncbi:damage-inducible protein DinB [Bosea sp. Tri-44]|uniref:DinB family protein n=1 Tax=Bosea sp. Tri-44 TaxID=1972137 RepID=UPI00100E45CB|nr:DinB family protein [Bosea sp. Tri-44]RXT48246.1 damage-inducible protein DinB [Bosea sp. Tri-44]